MMFERFFNYGLNFLCVGFYQRYAYTVYTPLSRVLEETFSKEESEG